MSKIAGMERKQAVINDRQDNLYR